MKTGRTRTKSPNAAEGKSKRPTRLGRLDVTPQWRASLSDYVTAIDWSPTGQWLGVASAAGEVMLYATDAKASGGGRSQQTSKTKTIALRQADGQAVSTLGFSSDGQWLAAAGQAGTIWVWAMEELMNEAPSLVAELHHPGAWIDHLAWHPHKPLVAFGVSKQVRIWDVTNKTEVTLDFPVSSVLHLVWHPQGKWLSVSGHGGLQVWDAADWQQPPQSIAVPGASLQSAWSPDGRYLASGNLDRTLTVAEWDKPPPWLMQGFPGKVRLLAWTPLGSAIPQLAAACAEGVTVWERKGRDWASQVLQHHQRTVVALAFQPQGTLLASASQDGRVSLWHHSKKLAHKLKGFDQGASCLSWRSCGARLAVGGNRGEVSIWQIVTHQAKGFGKSHAS